MSSTNNPDYPSPVPRPLIRPVKHSDIESIAALDEANTGISKPDYWQDIYTRYGGKKQNRFFLVAHDPASPAGIVFGFIIGEVRAWEFGSRPNGWIFALGVDPGFRQSKVGTRLFEAICRKFSATGVEKVRTLLSQRDELNMAFFRSQGMTGGPFIQLEMSLSDFKS